MTWRIRPPRPLVTVPLDHVRPEIIRAWAADHGWDVEPGGRLSEVVLEEYADAHRIK